MPIDPVFLLIALLPLIGYLLLLGFVRLSGKALVTTGGRDLASLGFAISGLVAIGPGELFFPKSAAGVFGPWVWVALIAFYSLIVSLIALTSRPRLVVFGRTPDQMLEPLFESAKKLDETATVDNEKLQVYLPKLGIRLRAAGHIGVDATYVESFELVTSIEFWNTLLGHLRDKASEAETPTPRRGGAMVVAAILLSAIVVWQGLQNHQQLVQGFREWLWR